MEIRRCTHSWLYLIHTMTMNIPKCPRCKVKMGKGVGINPTTPDCLKRALGGPEPYITNKDLRLDEVWKCKKCGHSADLDDSPRI